MNGYFFYYELPRVLGHFELPLVMPLGGTLLSLVSFLQQFYYLGVLVVSLLIIVVLM